MNKQDLIKLEKAASLTPAEIKKQQPALFNKLNEKAGVSLKISATTKLKNAPKNIKASFAKLDFSPAKLSAIDVKTVLTKSLISGRTAVKKKKEIEVQLAGIPDLGKIDDILQPDLPILLNPIFQPELKKARVFRLTDIAGFSKTKSDKLIGKDFSLETMSDEKLKSLVTEKTLTDKDAKKMGLLGNLHTLFDANFELTEFTSIKTIPKLKRKIQVLEDLIQLEKEDWKKLVVDAKIELPKDLKTEDYAEVLYKKTENLFPDKTLTFRITKTEVKSLTKVLTSLKSISDINTDIFGINAFEDLNTGKLKASTVKKLKGQYQNINRLVRIHPGLKIPEILNDDNLTSSNKGKRVVERIGLYKKFVDNNPDVDYLSLNYAHDSEDLKSLDFTGLRPEEKTMVLNSAMSYQRVYAFTNDIEHTESVMAGGFHSAYQITLVTLNDFTKATKLKRDVANTYFENAHESIIRTTAFVGEVLDNSTGSFNWTDVGNTSPAIKNFLKDIPGYQDLFGQLTFCDCEHCQSIFSPAAYFVDLMQFVEKHILKEYFATSNANHVLNLKVRRPDLWVLPLTCENTTTFVPYLEIINEILVTYIANIAKENGDFIGNLNDQTAVKDFVYKKEIALELPANVAWKKKVHSFSQPFHLPLKSLSTYLSHFDRTRVEVAILLGKPKEEVSKAKLNLSEKEFQLIIVTDKTPAFLTRIYNITFTIAQGVKIKPFDVQQLLKPMGLNRKELGRLIATQFVTDKGNDTIFILGEKINQNSIQNDVERIKNLTFNNLDRAHRFVRLWQKLSWSIEELDLVLTQLEAKNISSGINAAAISEIGNLLSLQEKLNVSAEELCALWGSIPIVSVLEKQQSLFDSLFNHEEMVSTSGSYPKDTILFVHPALIIDGLTPSAEFLSGRLMTGLNRTDTEVLTIIQNLAQSLGIVNIDSATENERGFNLTLQNLSLMYRHSKMAELLKVSIDELFQLMLLVDNLPNGHIENIEHLNATLDFHRWWKTTSYSLDELHFIIKSSAIATINSFQTKESITQVVLEQAEAESALLFADTIFAIFFDDVTEEQSKAIIVANAATIELSPDGDGTNYWLKPTFDSGTALAIPPDITRSEIELRSVLIEYHPEILIPHYISSQLSLSEKQIAKLIIALGIDLNAPAYTLELQELTTPAVIVPQLIEKLIPLSVLFKDKKFDNDVLDYVVIHLNVFDIASIDSISVNNIQKLHLFTQLLSKQEDETYNVDLINDVVNTFIVAQQFQNADQNQLAALLNTESGLLATLHPVMGNLTNAFESLEKLVKLIEITAYLGIGGDILSLIVSSTYDDLQDAEIGILAAFRTKYKSEDELNEKLEAYQDKLRGYKRAALTNYLIHSGFPQFENKNDLFNYFLIDVELEGCARTSRLVAATMSLQLYVHRILLNLEQDDKELGVTNKLHVLADKLPVEEWAWRKNYRVWEANRKVFLYPENYIEPGYRDNKTFLFEELESELLQQEINEDTVLEAYAKYMRGFDELAHLKIAGSYHEKDEDTNTDTLHLFGVTSDEPPIYYYRAVENIYYSEKEKNRGVVWNPWQKINVQIPVRKAAPIIFNGRLYVFWVRITTLSKTTFRNNESVFLGYDHKFSIEFTRLKLDGTWTPPQKLNLETPGLIPFIGNGVLTDSFFNNTLEYDTKNHSDIIDDYTLTGFMWEQIYPSIDHFGSPNGDGTFIITGVGYELVALIDFYNLSTRLIASRFRGGTESTLLDMNSFCPRKILWREKRSLHMGITPNLVSFFNYAYCSLAVQRNKKDQDLIERNWSLETQNIDLNDNIKQDEIAKLNFESTIQIINGAYSDAIIDDYGDLLLVQGSPFKSKGFQLKRIGTTLSETLTRTLFTSGVGTMLNIETQKALKEAKVPITITNFWLFDRVVKDKIDFKGAYGGYYREIFFHIPALLANHLNSQGKYAEAQKWYHYIFNPTASESINFTNSTFTSAEKKKMELDRNWRYIEFRDINTKKLKEQLLDKQAIEVYKKDPFNPHAIARLRLSAYQKNIVMKYIDNLLDWGDYLFTQDTMESVNEATLLFTIAKEILGERPAEIGSCGEGKLQPKTYEKISPLLSQNSEFLAAIENYTNVNEPVPVGPKTAFVLDVGIINTVSMRVSNDSNIGGGNYQPSANLGVSLAQASELKLFDDKRSPNTSIKPADNTKTSQFSIGPIRGLNWKQDSFYVHDRNKLPSFGGTVLSHLTSVFCIPGNKDLLHYWDRVDDRLFKIRNCMNIQGQRRQLALFAPEIDPRILVRAKAAGLSIDDILNSISGNLPPYRFNYIIERAKSYTAVVQNFGASLLSAMEKKEGEELVQLRMLHQQNILEMVTKSRKLEIDSANEGVKIINDRIESLNYRNSYYEGLISENLNNWETEQSIARHLSTIIHGTELPLGWMAGTMYLIPQVGSPFAMKYGGAELGASADAFYRGLGTLATTADSIAASTGLEAGFERRKQGWKHQKKLVELELKQAEKSLIAAEIRRDILIQSDKIHKKNIEHNNEVMEFYGDKFSNLGLYTYLSTTMQRLFREAYNNANAVAKLAEQAYKFERDDNTSFLDRDYFESPRAGLLAGERLFMGLQAMERRYLETNYRKIEIDQAFSITQLDPSALLLLKQTGSCEFSIPEIFFDLFYPGQYRRKIKSVRLTIPSITGPYTNVSANLSLIESDIRMEAKLGAAELKKVPKSRTTNIATSTAQNDAGVFQLNFNDSRYMPFEGAGAISSWKLSLPKNFKQFDYNSINDAVIGMSYTAEYDELFRDKIEEQNDAIEGTILNVLKNNPLSRTFSFRQEFSNDFHRLTEQPIGSPLTFKIENKHFPLFMNGRSIKVTTAKLILVTPSGQNVGALDIVINGTSVNGFAKDNSIGELFAKDLGNNFFNSGIQKSHTISIAAGGNLTPTANPVGVQSAIHPEKLEDIVLFVEYTID